MAARQNDDGCFAGVVCGLLILMPQVLIGSACHGTIMLFSQSGLFIAGVHGLIIRLQLKFILNCSWKSAFATGLVYES